MSEVPDLLGALMRAVEAARDFRKQQAATPADQPEEVCCGGEEETDV